MSFVKQLGFVQHRPSHELKSEHLLPDQSSLPLQPLLMTRYKANFRNFLLIIATFCDLFYGLLLHEESLAQTYAVASNLRSLFD